MSFTDRLARKQERLVVVFLVRSVHDLQFFFKILLLRGGFEIKTIEFEKT